MPRIGEYLEELDRIRQASESTPELSLREPFLGLLRRSAERLGRSGLLIAQEASAGDVGQPDVFIKQGPRLLGFAETKRTGYDLDRGLRRTKQLKRYLQSLPNWVLSDYYNFIVIRNGEVIQEFDIREITDEAYIDKIASFLDYVPPLARTPNQLAHELARRARLLRDGLLGSFRREPEDGELHQVLAFYRERLMDDLTTEEFADTFAQTITYGLFLAWLRTGDTNTPFSRGLARRQIPQSIPFLRSAVRLLTQEDLLPTPVLRLLDDLAALLDNSDPERIRTRISDGAGRARDPIIYFYEDFLELYDKGERVKRGVYYTPPELVDFLVRAVDQSLRADFDRDLGLASHDVRLLDPAVGTGTFLLSASQTALQAVEGRGTAIQRSLIREHLLVHFHGFELLPAPYAVAHLKMSNYFADAGYELSDQERISVYVTNTLLIQEHEEQQLMFLPMIRGIVEEAEQANEIKTSTPILVVLGNPPYERTSHNRNPHSDRLQQDFYRLEGEPLPDRNKAPLGDDYLRFMRWGVWKLLEQANATGQGVLAFVTNRAWIERVLHRGVRHFLLEKFDDIYIFDLHGDQREWFADRTDQKVFKQVQAGISLNVFIRRDRQTAGADRARVHYRDSFGTRAEKFDQLSEASLDDGGWTELTPRAPLWLFVPYNVPDVYDAWPTVGQLFPSHVIGVQTHRDQLVVAPTERELTDRLDRFAAEDSPASEWDRIGVKSRGKWDRETVQSSLREDPPKRVIHWHYRGLERQWVSLDGRLADRPRGLSDHLLERDDNLALVFAKGSLPDGPYALVSRRPVPAAALSWRTLGQAYFAPLWLHEPVAERWVSNIPTSVAAQLSKRFDADALALLHYVYAVLNSVWFRDAYQDGLRYGLARIPIAIDPAVFSGLRQHGARLTRLHLLESDELDEIALRVDGDDESPIGPIRFDADTQTVHLGDKLAMSPVSPAEWEYRQGGYRIIQSFLESREDRPLVTNEFNELRDLVGSIRLTLELLPNLDALVQEATRSALSSEDLGLELATPE